MSGKLTFTRLGYATIMDGLVIRHYPYGNPDSRSQISASRNRVMVNGEFTLRSDDDIAAFTAELGLAMQEHRDLARGLEPNVERASFGQLVGRRKP